MVSVRDGEEDVVRVERNDAGDIVELSQGNRVARFGRDELGRIAEASLPDGASVRYFYDSLGNPVLAEYGGGVSVRVSYNAGGGAVGLTKTDLEGSVRRLNTTVADSKEPITHDERTKATGKYRAVKRLAEFENGGRSVVVSYGTAGTVARFRTAAPLVWEPLSEPDHVSKWDTIHTVWAAGESLRVRRPDYGRVPFANDLQAAQVALAGRVQTLEQTLLEARVPSLHLAKALVAAPLVPQGLDAFSGRSLVAWEYRVAGQWALEMSNSMGGDVGRDVPSRNVDSCRLPVCRPVVSLGGFDHCTQGISQAVDPTLDTNGCSTPVPTLFEDVFTPSCDIHDVCYNRCGSGQDSCDGEFGNNLQLACRTVAAALRPLCRFEAVDYVAAVALKGGPLYEEAQVRHCYCCN